MKFRLIKLSKHWVIKKDGGILSDKKGMILFSSRTKAINRFLWELYKWLKGSIDFTISVDKEGKDG